MVLPYSQPFSPSREGLCTANACLEWSATICGRCTQLTVPSLPLEAQKRHHLFKREFQRAIQLFHCFTTAARLVCRGRQR